MLIVALQRLNSCVYHSPQANAMQPIETIAAFVLYSIDPNSCQEGMLKNALHKWNEYIVVLYLVLYTQNFCTKTCSKSALHKSHECYIYT